MCTFVWEKMFFHPELLQHTMRKQSQLRWKLGGWLFALLLQGVNGQIPDTGIVQLPPWRFVDLNIIKTPLPHRPDTLLIGEYVIAVERYDTAGPFAPAAGLYSKVSGIGRVVFSCRPPVTFPPFPPGDVFLSGGVADVPLTPFLFHVVDSVRYPEKEIALENARIFDKNIRRGAALTLTLPLPATSPPADIGKKMDDLLQVVKFGSPRGIRVQFRDVDIQIDLANPRVGRITAGTAFYPSSDPVPLPPFTLDIEGFTLEVSRLTIFTDRAAEAVARLLLPDLISSGKDCSRAALDINCIKYELLGMSRDDRGRKTFRIRVTNNCAQRLVYMAVQLPNGTVARAPAGDSVYLSPDGRSYVVRNPNFSPFYSLRFTPQANGIQNGESDVFTYTLPPQADQRYIRIVVRLEPQTYHEATLSASGCTTEAGVSMVYLPGSGGAAASYGPYGIGNTTLVVNGKGFIADFSSLIGFPPGGGSTTWKGLILTNGETAGEPPGSVYSNTGYLQAHYKYTVATVTKNGFSGELGAGDPYTFYSIQPYGYDFRFDTAHLKIENNRLVSGELLKARIALPVEAVRDRAGGQIAVQSERLHLNSELDILGTAVDAGSSGWEFFWGEFTKPGKEILAFGVSKCRAGVLFMPGQYHKDYYPVEGEAFAEPTPVPVSDLHAKALGMTGLTIYDPTNLFIQSPDVPSPPNPYPRDVHYLEYGLVSNRTIKRMSWLNIQSQGVHSSLYADYLDRPQQLGNPASPYYAGKIPFYFWTYFRDKQFGGSIELHFVESAVFHSDVQGGVQLPMPAESNLLVRKLAFTSTAQIAGGEVDLSIPAKLAFWGLELVPRPGYSSNGVLSVKTGQIILTAAGLTEIQHFKEPFYLTWGEMLASGSLGRLFFDYHTAGQQFDGFDFTPAAVALSDYPGASPPYGFLRVGGTAHFPFFGNDYLHLLDRYDPSRPIAPFNKRVIELVTKPFGAGFFASDTTLYGNWADGLGVFDIKRLYYNNALQNGFAGEGLSALQTIGGSPIASSLILQSDNACIGFHPGTGDYPLRIAPFNDITLINQIWGCVCIRNDRIDNLVFGGNLTVSSNALMIVARSGQFMSMVFRMSPSEYEIVFDGTATMSVAASVDLEVNGHLSLLFNKSNLFLEGEADGFFRTAAGAILAGSSLSGEGQANWHIGLNPLDGRSYRSLQGSISVNVMGMVATAGSGAGLNAGFYYGVNAPKSEAWVLLGGDPRYQLNMAALPDRLTGVYGYVEIKAGINLVIISGGYEFFVGVGAFILDFSEAVGLGGLPPGLHPELPYAVGHLGGRIHGEFLAGLVSGGAWVDLQLIGPYPFSFQGAIGIEACALWVACTTYHFTVGLNTSEGFYVRH